MRHKLDTNWFRLTNMTVLTSKKPISMVQWRDYLIKHQSSLMRDNERILILAGIHGERDGQLGESDQGLVRDSLGQIGVLERRFETRERGPDWIVFNAPRGGENVTVKFMDIGSLLSDTDTDNHLGIDEKQLVKAVRDFLPTVLVLGFCWTEKSVLNDVFRSAGVYSILVLSRDRREITRDRCIFLDEQQTKMIDDIASENPQNVMFWGVHGTGKTLMLLEAARIKAGHHKRRGKQVDITFLVYNGDCGPFVQDIMTKYDLSSVEIAYEPDLQTFCGKIGVDGDIYGDAMKSLPLLAKAISDRSKDDRDKHSILVVDEIPSSKRLEKADWSKFEASLPNVDLIFSLDIPLWPFDYHEIKEPEGDSTMSFRLGKVYRNSRSILRLIFFAHTHDDSFARSGNDFSFGQSSINTPMGLPPGNVPVWLRAKPDARGTLRALLEVIRDGFIDPEDSVTMMCFSDGVTKKDHEWLEQNKWKFCHCAFDDGTTSMRGKSTCT